MFSNPKTKKCGTHPLAYTTIVPCGHVFIFIHFFLINKKLTLSLSICNPYYEFLNMSFLHRVALVFDDLRQ